jgi:hypothetical protein
VGARFAADAPIVGFFYEPEEGSCPSCCSTAPGRRRSPATMPGLHAGRPPRNNGLRYPADPPKVEEIIAVMREAGDELHGRRLRGLIVVLWRAGLRIQEAFALTEADLDPRRGALLVRRPKGGRRREVGIDAAWTRRAGSNFSRGSSRGANSQVGPLFCVINGAIRDRHWSPAAARATCVASRPRRTCGAGSRRTNYVTRTPSRWRAKACR